MSEPPETYDADLAKAVQQANVPTLLLLLVQLTGDVRWLEPPYQPTRSRGLEDNDTGGMPASVQQEIREATLEAIQRWQDGRPPVLQTIPYDLLIRMMSVSMGEQIPWEYAPMLASELGTGEDRGSQQPHRVPPPQGFTALIIGAGVSGIAAAINLSAAGIPYRIVEKNPDIGGTWLDNHYPGCGVDTPSHLYSFSFAPHDWAHYFASQDELHDYLAQVADDFDVRRHISFRTEVVKAEYDENGQSWVVTIRQPDSGVESIRADIVISAVGAFTRPKYPAIPGLDTFRGPVVHTARWDDSLDLTGARVAVIGTGASAMQLVPAIADQVSSLTIFQRSPQWAAPFEKFHAEVPDAVRYLMSKVPLYQAWYRTRLAWTFHDKVHSTLQKDPAWAHPDRSVSAANDGHRIFFTKYIVAELGDRQDLLGQVLPGYPPFGKRMLMDNGWFRTLTRPDVNLVTEPVVTLAGDHLETADGAQYPADIIVIATGFDVVSFLAPIEVRGRTGRTLRESWDGDDARAYLGLTIPGYPNFFCLYGPNTQTGHGGSLIYTVELQIHYLMSLLNQMFEHEVGVVECRQDVYDAYNEKVDRAHDRMIWTHPGMDTYYRNERGRVVVNSPFRVLDIWAMTRNASMDDYLSMPRRPKVAVAGQSAIGHVPGEH